MKQLVSSVTVNKKTETGQPSKETRTLADLLSESQRPSFLAADLLWRIWYGTRRLYQYFVDVCSLVSSYVRITKVQVLLGCKDKFMSFIIYI